MFKRATAFYYIIERKNEIDLKNTGMGREIENILTKKEKNSSLKFTRFDFYQNRANIRPKGEREFPIDLRLRSPPFHLVVQNVPRNKYSKR